MSFDFINNLTNNNDITQSIMDYITSLYNGDTLIGLFAGIVIGLLIALIIKKIKRK